MALTLEAELDRVVIRQRTEDARRGLEDHRTVVHIGRGRPTFAIADRYTLWYALAYNAMAGPEFVKLPLLAQTAYARLLDLLLTTEIGDPLAGDSLVSKSIRGRRYWYAQRLEDGKKVQNYLGPETPEILSLIERWRRGKTEASTRAELIAMARAGGAHAIGAAEANVIERLAPVFHRRSETRSAAGQRYQSGKGASPSQRASTGSPRGIARGNRARLEIARAQWTRLDPGCFDLARRRPR